MAWSHYLSLLLIQILFNFLSCSSNSQIDTITKTVKGFFGYPPIQKPYFDLNQIRNAEVSNLSLGASPRDIEKFFSHCGNIESVEMRSDLKQHQIAFVTFENTLGAQCAVLLSGTNLVDLAVTITLAPRLQLQHDASSNPATEENTTAGAEYLLLKSKDVFSSILAKGYVLGRSAVNQAKAFDEKYQLISITMDIVSTAKSAVLRNEYVSVGASWLMSAYDSIGKAAVEVAQHAKEKVAAEEELRRKTE